LPEVSWLFFKARATMNRRITSSDIARAAGVSQTTVSFVLNKTEGTSISAKTKARVLRAAEALGYVPNSAARTLVSGRTRTLGLVLARGDLMSFDAFAPPLMFGISRVCNLHGYKLLIEAVEPSSKRDAYFHLTRSKSIDALIVLNSSSEDQGLVRLIESHFPVVLFGSIHHPEENSISPNTSRAVEQIALHLLELGHRRIGHITYAPLRYVGASERLKAFRRGLGRVKANLDESLVGLGDFSVESGYRAMRKILQRGRHPTALFAGNDTIAVGAISALRDAGLSVPGHVAVAGFDDLPMAAYVSPRLTTVATQAVAQGEQAALAAIELLKGQTVGKRICNLSLEFVIRESCGADRRNSSFEERRLIV
jgi:DNA-binding LacI/PurR family transcriptional regulator